MAFDRALDLLVVPQALVGVTVQNCGDLHSRGHALKVIHSQLRVEHCVFSGNTNSEGAVLIDEKANPVFRFVTFINNVAGSVGGALFIAGGSPRFTNCQFIGNSGNLMAVGAAVMILSPDGVYFVDCTFRNNQCLDPTQSGGAIFSQGPLILTNCHFDGNRAGGGGAVMIYAPFKADGCIFSNNSAFSATAGSGGAALLIAGQGTVADVFNSTFSSNWAAGAGGAIYVLQMGLLNCSRCRFSKNSQSAADLGGAALYLQDSGTKASLPGSYFDRNIAAGSGGAVRVGALPAVSGEVCTFSCPDCVYNGNKAAKGGALNLGPLHIIALQHSKFTDNYATFGGAIWKAYDKVWSWNCDLVSVTDTAVGNRAAQAGGLLFVSISPHDVLPECVVQLPSTVPATAASAGMYGAIVATSANSVALLSVQGSKASNQIIAVAPSSKISMLVSVFDAFKQRCIQTPPLKVVLTIQPDTTIKLIGNPLQPLNQSGIASYEGVNAVQVLQMRPQQQFDFSVGISSPSDSAADASADVIKFEAADCLAG